MRSLEQRILGQGVRAVSYAVRLDVAFVDHIDAIFVAEVIPPGVVGVVASAHCVDVEFLENLYVTYHLFFREYISTFCTDFVAVCSFEEDRLSVDEQLGVADDNLPEADIHEADFFGAVACCRGDSELVEIGAFCAPQVDFSCLHRSGECEFAFTCRRGAEVGVVSSREVLDGGSAAGDFLACGVQKVK